MKWVHQRKSEFQRFMNNVDEVLFYVVIASVIVGVAVAKQGVIIAGIVKFFSL